MADTIKRLLVKLAVDTSEFEAAIRKLKQELDALKTEGEKNAQSRKQTIDNEIANRKEEQDIVKKVLDTATEYVAQLELQESVTNRVVMLSNLGLESRRAEIDLEEALLRLIMAESEFTAENLRNLEKELAVDRERLAVNQAQLRMQTIGIAGPVAAKPTASAVATSKDTIRQAEELKSVSIIELGELQKVVSLERARTDVLAAQAKVLLSQRDYRKQEISLVTSQLEAEKLLLEALERRLGVEERIAARKGGKSAQIIGTGGRTRRTTERVEERPIVPRVVQTVETTEVSTIQERKLELLDKEVVDHRIFAEQLRQELATSERLLATKSSEEGVTKRELASIQSEVNERTKSLAVAERQLSSLEQKQSLLRNSLVLAEKSRIEAQVEQEVVTRLSGMTSEQVAQRQKQVQQELSLLTAKKSQLELSAQDTEVSRQSAEELTQEYDTQRKRLLVEQDILRARKSAEEIAPRATAKTVTGPTTVGVAAIEEKMTAAVTEARPQIVTLESVAIQRRVVDELKETILLQEKSFIAQSKESGVSKEDLAVVRQKIQEAKSFVSLQEQIVVTQERQLERERQTTLEIQKQKEAKARIPTEAGVSQALGLAAESASVSVMSEKQAAAKMEELGAERQLLAVEEARLQLELKRGVLDKAAIEQALKLVGIKKQENLLAMERVRLATAKAGEGIFTGIKESLTKVVEEISGGGLFGQIVKGTFTGFVGAEIFTGLIEQVHKLGEALIDASGRAGILKTEFNKLATDRGSDPTRLIQNLRVSTRGLVDDTKLYEIAGRFMRQNMQVTNEQITKLIGTTLDLATATGRSTPEAMSALERAAASGRMQMLAYAVGLTNADLSIRGLTGSISPAAKNTLQFNQILLAEQAALRKLAEPATTLPQLFQQITVAEKNFIDDMAEGVITSGNFGKTIADVSKYLQDIRPQLEEFAKKVGKDLADGIKFAVSHLAEFKTLLEAIIAIKIVDWIEGFSLGLVGLAKNVGILLDRLGMLKVAQEAEAATTVATVGAGVAAGEVGAAAGGVGLAQTIPVIGQILDVLIGIAAAVYFIREHVAGKKEEQSAALIAQYEKYGAVSKNLPGGPEWLAQMSGMYIPRGSPGITGAAGEPGAVGGVSEGQLDVNKQLNTVLAQVSERAKIQEQPPLDLQSVQQAIEIAKLKQKVAEEHAKTLLGITKQNLADQEDATKRSFERGLLTMKDYIDKEKALKVKALDARLNEIDEEAAAQKAAIDQESVAKRKIDQARLDQLNYTRQQDIAAGKTGGGEDYIAQVESIKQAMELQDSSEVRRQRYAVIDAQTEQKKVDARAQTNRELLAEDDKLLEDQVAARKAYDSSIIKVQKDSTSVQEKLLEEQFSNGLVSAQAYIDQRTSLIEKQRDLQLQELTQEEQDTKKTEAEKAQIRVQMVQAQIDAEKSLTEFTQKEDQIRVEATENQYKNIQKYLTAQEEIGKNISQTGRVEGFQLQVAAEEQMLAYSQKEQLVLEEQLKTVTEGSDAWYKVVQQIGAAAQAQIKLRDELLASRDIVGQMGGLFGILGNLIGESGAKAAGWLSRMSVVFKQMSDFNKMVGEQGGVGVAAENLLTSFKGVLGLGSAPKQEVQQDKLQLGVEHLQSQLDKSAGAQSKYADKIGQLILQLEAYRQEIQKQINEGFSKVVGRETPGEIPTSELLPQTPEGELPTAGTQESLASFFTGGPTPAPVATGGTAISNLLSPATTGVMNFVSSLKQASSQLTTVTTVIRAPAAPTVIGEGERGGGGGASVPMYEGGGAPTAIPGVVGAIGGGGAMSEVISQVQGLGTAADQTGKKMGGWSDQFASFVKNLSGWVQGLGAVFSSIAGAKTTTGGAMGGGMALGGIGASVGGAMESMKGLFGMSTAFAGPIGAAVGTVLGSVLGGIIGNKQQMVTQQVNGIKEDLDAIQLSLQNNTQTIGGAIGELQQLQSTTAASLGHNKKATKSGQYQAVMQQIQQEIQQLQIQQQQILQDLSQQLGILSQSTPAMQQIMQNLDTIITKYQNFASAAAGNSQAMAEANQYLVESLQQYTTTLQNQVRSANEQAIGDALQLIQLQNQLNEANMQEYNILTQGVLARQRSQAMTKGMQIEQIEAQKANIQEQYNVEQFKVQAESKIFDLATSQLGLEQQMASLQEQDVVIQMAGIEAEVQALMELQNALSKGGVSGLPPGLLSPTGGVNIQQIEQLLGLPITLPGGQPYIPNMPQAYQTFESDISMLPGMASFAQNLLAAAQTPFGSKERQGAEQQAIQAQQGLQSMGAIVGNPGQDPNWQNFLSWIMETMTYQGYQTGGMVPETSAAVVHAGEYIIPSDVFKNFISSLNTFASALDGFTATSSSVDNTVQTNTMGGIGVGVGVGLTQEIANAITIALRPLFSAMGVQTVSKESLSLPAYQTGGYIPKDTTAELHSGEVVLPQALVSFISNMTGMNGTTVNTLSPVISEMSNLPQNFANNLKFMMGIPASGPLGERTAPGDIVPSPRSPLVPPAVRISELVQNAGQTVLNNSMVDTHTQIMNMAATRVGMESDLLIQQKAQVQSDMLRISMLTELLDRMASSGVANNGMLSLEGGFQKLYELRGRYGSGSFRREVL